MKFLDFGRYFGLFFISYHLGAVSMGVMALSLSNDSLMLSPLVIASKLFMISTYYISWILFPVVLTVAAYKYFKNKELLK